MGVGGNDQNLQNFLYESAELVKVYAGMGKISQNFFLHWSYFLWERAALVKNSGRVGRF